MRGFLCGYIIVIWCHETLSVETTHCVFHGSVLFLSEEACSNQERLGVLAAPRMVRSTFLNARLRSAVPKHA